MTLANQCRHPPHQQRVVGQYVGVVVDLSHGHRGSRDDGLRPERGIVCGDKTLLEGKKINVGHVNSSRSMEV